MVGRKKTFTNSFSFYSALCSMDRLIIDAIAQLDIENNSHSSCCNIKTKVILGEKIITGSKQLHTFAFVVLLCLPEHFKQCIIISKLVKYVLLLVHARKQEEMMFVHRDSLCIYAACPE